VNLTGEDNRTVPMSLAVNASLNVLKQSGVLFVSFINLFAGIIYIMRDMPELDEHIVVFHSMPCRKTYLERMLK